MLHSGCLGPSSGLPANIKEIQLYKYIKHKGRVCGNICEHCCMNILFLYLCKVFTVCIMNVRPHMVYLLFHIYIRLYKNLSGIFNLASWQQGYILWSCLLYYNTFILVFVEKTNPCFFWFLTWEIYCVLLHLVIWTCSELIVNHLSLSSCSFIKNAVASKLESVCLKLDVQLCRLEGKGNKVFSPYPQDYNFIKICLITVDESWLLRMHKKKAKN